MTSTSPSPKMRATHPPQTSDNHSSTSREPTPQPTTPTQELYTRPEIVYDTHSHRELHLEPYEESHFAAGKQCSSVGFAARGIVPICTSGSSVVSERVRVQPGLLVAAAVVFMVNRMVAMSAPFRSLLCSCYDSNACVCTAGYSCIV